MDVLFDLLVRLITLAVAFTVHELAHAITAVYLGDDTPRWEGRLSLNPLVHLDPWGALFFLLSGFGWAKPVPVNPHRLRHRYGMAWVAVAGPLSNLALAVAGGAFYRLGGGRFWSLFWLNFVALNLILFLFNLLPLPPLDGSKIVADLAPRFWAQYLAPLERYAPAIFLLVIFALPRVGLDVLYWLVLLPARVLMGWLL